jgi:hypothetical protein
VKNYKKAALKKRIHHNAVKTALKAGTSATQDTPASAAQDSSAPKPKTIHCDIVIS